MKFDIYLEKVKNEEDLILFKDAIKCANNGIYRGAFILTWLCGIESLKRRFKECGKQDKRANDTYSQIIKAEKQHKAVDESIIERALNYGFIDELEQEKLKQLYKLRSVFAHPYNAEPHVIELENAINLITAIILSRPTLLSEGFINNLVGKLSNDKCYLNDFEKNVKEETKIWVNKINPNYYKYFIENYTKIAEQTCADKSLQIFINRAKWVLEEFIKSIGYDIYNKNEWHDFVSTYPKMSLFLAFRNPDFFLNIGILGQNYIINKVIELSSSYPSWLEILIPFLEKEEILRENHSKVLDLIQKTPFEALKSIRIPFKFICMHLIKELESGDFYRQNPATLNLQSNENLLKEVPNEILLKLGKTLHEASLNNAFDAKEYITKIINNSGNYPIYFLFGICDALIYTSTSYSCILDYAFSSIIQLINNSEENIKEQLITRVNHNIKECFKQSRYTSFEEFKKDLIENKYIWMD